MQPGSSQWRLWLPSWKGLSDPDAIIERIERAEAKSKSTSKAADMSVRCTRASQGQAGESPASTQGYCGGKRTASSTFSPLVAAAKRSE
jgi:hypothetical protein